jgi:TolA-binding protein
MRLRPHLRRLLPLLLGSLATIIVLGCAPDTENQQVQADQFALRGMVANNQQQIDALQEKIQRLDDRVSELEHNGPAEAGSANQLASIEQRLDKLESPTNSSSAGAANAPLTPTANPEAPAPSPAEAAPGAGGTVAAGSDEEAPDTGEGAPAQAATTPPNSGPVAPPNAPSWRDMMDQQLAASHDDPGAKLYRAGLVQLKANNYSQALGPLQALQRHYPKSSLSEPAEFFAANALYQMGKYDQAILQFNDQTMRFPKGRFASAALLREAQAFMKINDRIDARLTLQKLLSDLPDSAEAPMAKSMMQTLAS